MNRNLHPVARRALHGGVAIAFAATSLSLSLSPRVATAAPTSTTSVGNIFHFNVTYNTPSAGTAFHMIPYNNPAVPNPPDAGGGGTFGTFTINAADGTFTARLLVPAPDLGGTRLDGGFTGRWVSRDDLILTAITVPT